MRAYSPQLRFPCVLITAALQHVYTHHCLGIVSMKRGRVAAKTLYQYVLRGVLNEDFFFQGFHGFQGNISETSSVVLIGRRKYLPEFFWDFR